MKNFQVMGSSGPDYRLSDSILMRLMVDRLDNSSNL